jgi:hypothetical protein
MNGARLTTPVNWRSLVCLAGLAALAISPPAHAQAVEEFYYNVIWVHRTDVGTMGKRFGHAMAYDSSRGVTVFFGGEYGEPGEDSGFFNDTWEYDGHSWKPIAVENEVKPGSRSEHTMVFDTVNNQVVLFGGVGEDRYYNDTWTYVGTGPGTGRWQRRANLPGAGRAGHAMVFDPRRFAVLVTGGKPEPEQIEHQQVSECWEWFPANDVWLQMATSVGFSGGSELGAGLTDHEMFYDAKTGDTYVLGGRGPFGLEIVDNARVMKRDAGSGYFGFLPGNTVTRYSGASVYFAHRDALMRFGGHGFTGHVGLHLVDFRFWGWPGSTQPIRNFPLQDPPDRARNAVVYDSRRQVAVVFGGQGPGQTPYADTWELVSYVPGETWANFAHQGIENGTQLFPFNTLIEGVEAVSPGGTLKLQTSTSAERLTITKPLTLEAVGGPVTIGQ